MKHIYHYHAFYQNSTGICHGHGLYKCDEKIQGYKAYSDLEKFLSEHMLGNPNPEQIVIDSLSYLGECTE